MTKYTDQEIKGAAERLERQLEELDPATIEFDDTSDLRAIAEAVDAQRAAEAQVRERVEIARAHGRSWGLIRTTAGCVQTRGARAVRRQGFCRRRRRISLTLRRRRPADAARWVAWARAPTPWTRPPPRDAAGRIPSAAASVVGAWRSPAGLSV